MAAPQLKPFFQQECIEAGCDEAGRGCLAGPVFAAAVILPKDFSHPLLNDSKKLTHKQRLKLRETILEQATSWAVSSIDNQKIDEINILNASFKAMHQAIDQLKTQPGHLIIDGNRFTPYKNISHDCIVEGDGKYLSIAAASILAKTYRDEYMETLHQKHPHYSWNTNKGYGTPAHKKAIREHGISPYHRISFNLYAEQLSINFPE